MSGSVGIIGGADGPTAIYVASTGSPWAAILVFAAAAAVGVYLYRRRKKK